METLMKVEKAAQALDVSPKTIRKWLAERKINYVKVGGAVRIAASELDRIAKEGTRERIAL